MKMFLVLLFVAFGASETVHDGVIFDLFDIKELMRDDTLRPVILACVRGESPCGEYQLIGDKGANILKTQCADCTPEQKAKFGEIIKEFEKEHNKEYNELKAKFFADAPK